MEVCAYCGEPKGERMGCCGENHWEEMPDCPGCGSENVGRDGNTYECGDCGLTWPDNEVLETVVFGSGVPNITPEPEDAFWGDDGAGTAMSDLAVI